MQTPRVTNRLLGTTFYVAGTSQVPNFCGEVFQTRSFFKKAKAFTKKQFYYNSLSMMFEFFAISKFVRYARTKNKLVVSAFVD